MATPFPIPVTAAQVGTYFVGQYYQVLQQQPNYVHQFYSDVSTMIRIDGSAKETATAMLQIHTLIMSLKFTGVEIKEAHSLESWNGGVLVMVSGSVQINYFNNRRKFVQTFFLAPQEKGYFILNDIFHFIDDEPVYHHPAAMLAQCNSVGTTVQEPVSNYFLGGEIQSREFAPPADIKENGVVNNYSFPDQRLQQVPDTKHVMGENTVEEPTGSLQNTVNAAQDLHASVEEPLVESQRHTYASILQVAKAHATQVAPQPSANMNTSLVLEGNHASQSTTEQSVTSAKMFERSGVETAEEISGVEYEGEIKSVYVRNLPCNVTASEIEEEFKKFGKLSSDGVAIRSRKDVYGVCYAFVEFEDMSSVQNAIKASSVQIADRQVFIEERRPNSNIPFRGRRGRGRGGYQTEVARGGRIYYRYDGGERDYSRFRGNGFHRPASRQDRGF